MIYRTIRQIEVSDWNAIVRKTYGKPYNFQQQNGCQDRGQFHLSIPSDFTEEDEMNDSIPEVVNGDLMGVKFEVWLSRDPEKPLPDNNDFSLGLFWHRNFYPDIYTLANDLHKKGLIEAGDYVINIDW